MSQRHSVVNVRKNLASFVRVAESGRPVELTRRGELVAVLIGRRQYEQLARRARGFSQAYEGFQKDFDLAELDIEPEEVFVATRKQTYGRDVDL